MKGGAIRSVTVGVRDTEAALRLFRDVIGLSVEADRPASPDLVAAWGLPAPTRVRLVELSCHGYPVGRLRLAQYDPPAETVVRADATGGLDSPTDVGPKALDFYVRKPVAEAVAELERAGCRARSRPIRYEVGDVESEEVVLTGPDGVPLLIMYGHRHPPSSMRARGPRCAYSEIATVSVVCGDLEASRRFYAGALGLVAGTDAEVGPQLRDLACDLTGVPRGTRVALALYQEDGEPSGKYLLVHFFEATGRRLRGRMRPGHLGVSLFTHAVEALPALEARLRGTGAEILSGPSLVSGDGERRRVLLARGPNEELFEFVGPA